MRRIAHEVNYENSDKRKIIASIDDEVTKFHPLLEAILIKLPRIINVHHTHGPSEKGADFVVTRLDDVSGGNEHIGVIAKHGKIHQDFSKVETQIDECDEERIGFDSKKKVKLDEIWIFITESITNNALDKIHRKYSTRKIKFFQGKDIVDIIDKYYHNYWYELPIKVNDYFEKLNKRISIIDAETSLLRMGDNSSYIEQDIVESNWLEEVRNKRKKAAKINIFEEIKKNDFIFIEGDAGFGKSKLLRYIAKTLSNPIIFNREKFIPILISYKKLCDDYSFDLNFVVSNEVQDDVGGTEDGVKYILMIDGLDEKPFSNEEHLQNILNILEGAKKNSLKIVFATRPLNIIEGANEIDCEIKKYELEPLSIRKIIDFFHSFCEKSGISSRIVEDLKKSQLFNGLPRSPIATILLANLISENSKDLPSNLTELYSKYLELMLGRWEISKGLQSQKEYEALNSIVIKISEFFIDNDLHMISVDEAKGFLQNF